MIKLAAPDWFEQHAAQLWADWFERASAFRQDPNNARLYAAWCMKRYQAYLED